MSSLLLMSLSEPFFPLGSESQFYFARKVKTNFWKAQVFSKKTYHLGGPLVQQVSASLSRRVTEGIEKILALRPIPQGFQCNWLKWGPVISKILKDLQAIPTYRLQTLFLFMDLKITFFYLMFLF